MIKNHPMHWQRLSFLKKRLKLGKSDDEIVEEVRNLGWKDFNEGMTRFQIRQARKMNY